MKVLIKAIEESGDKKTAIMAGDALAELHVNRKWLNNFIRASISSPETMEENIKTILAMSKFFADGGDPGILTVIKGMGSGKTFVVKIFHNLLLKEGNRMVAHILPDDIAMGTYGKGREDLLFSPRDKGQETVNIEKLKKFIDSSDSTKKVLVLTVKDLLHITLYEIQHSESILDKYLMTVDEMHRALTSAPLIEGDSPEMGHIFLKYSTTLEKQKYQKEKDATVKYLKVVLGVLEENGNRPQDIVEPARNEQGGRDRNSFNFKKDFFDKKTGETKNWGDVIKERFLRAIGGEENNPFTTEQMKELTREAAWLIDGMKSGSFKVSFEADGKLVVTPVDRENLDTPLTGQIYGDPKGFNARMRVLMAWVEARNIDVKMEDFVGYINHRQGTQATTARAFYNRLVLGATASGAEGNGALLAQGGKKFQTLDETDLNDRNVMFRLFKGWDVDQMIRDIMNHKFDGEDFYGKDIKEKILILNHNNQSVLREL